MVTTTGALWDAVILSSEREKGVQKSEALVRCSTGINE
mgnify:CR=1 FL=1